MVQVTPVDSIIRYGTGDIFIWFDNQTWYRRRVDLFGEELEIGLKDKFQGHWYPEQPSKGSGYRCLKGNGDEVDPVVVVAAIKAGLDIVEVRSYLPEDLTLWIDPSEVSYKIGEKGPVKILYSDRKDEDGTDTVDKEVQAASRTFNPEAQTFTPESQQSFTPDMLAFTPDVAAFCSDSSQSFQPIDSLSSSLSNLSLSPSSPVPPGTWSTATSPSSNLFSSALTSSSNVPSSVMGPRPETPADSSLRQPWPRLSLDPQSSRLMSSDPTASPRQSLVTTSGNSRETSPVHSDPDLCLHVTPELNFYWTSNRE
ncbi:transducer of ERBB2 [Bulinus truncatus]|nr:transducer of ERBB2 [Bulinus truncatus]